MLPISSFHFGSSNATITPEPKKELVARHKSNIPIDKDGLATPSFENIINAENDYSQWRDRDDMWMSRK